MDEKDLVKNLRDGFMIISQSKSQSKEDDYLKSHLLFQRFSRLIEYLRPKDTTNLSTFTETVHIALSIHDQFTHSLTTIDTDDRSSSNSSSNNFHQVIHQQATMFIESYVSKVYPELLTLEQAVSYLRLTGAAGPNEPAHLFHIFEGEGVEGVSAAAECAVDILSEPVAKMCFRAAAEELVIKGMKETALYVLFKADENASGDIKQLLCAVLGDTLADSEGHKEVVGFAKDNAKVLGLGKDKRVGTLLELCRFFDLYEINKWEDALGVLENLEFFPLGKTTVDEAEKAVIGSGFPQEAQRNLPVILKTAMSAIYNAWENLQKEKHKYCKQAKDLTKFAELFRLVLPSETLDSLDKYNRKINQIN